MLSSAEVLLHYLYFANLISLKLWSTVVVNNANPTHKLKNKMALFKIDFFIIFLNSWITFSINLNLQPWL